MKVENNFKTQTCPFCNNPDIYKVGGIEYSNPLFFSSTEIELTLKPSLWKCKKCTSGFTQNSIQDNDLLSLYTNSDSSYRWSQETFQQNKSSEIIQELHQHFIQGAIVADVGCNTGELLDFAKACGTKTIGIELSKSSRDVIRQKGHQSLASLENIEDNSVDVITAFDLIEHLHLPSDFIKLCNEKLKVNGVLILLTGNINSVSSKLSGARWWYSCYPEHISFISKKYLSNLKEFKLIKAMPTYASKHYKYKFMRVLVGALIKLPLFQYKGLPSIGADHFLIVLEKTSNTHV